MFDKGCFSTNEIRYSVGEATESRILNYYKSKLALSSLFEFKLRSCYECLLPRYTVELLHAVLNR